MKAREPDKRGSSRMVQLGRKQCTLWLYEEEFRRLKDAAMKNHVPLARYVKGLALNVVIQLGPISLYEARSLKGR